MLSMTEGNCSRVKFAKSLAAPPIFPKLFLVLGSGVLCLDLGQKRRKISKSFNILWVTTCVGVAIEQDAHTPGKEPVVQ